MKYRIKKYHTAGILKGHTTTETTVIKMPLGKELKSCANSARYIVISREPINV